MLTLTHIHTHSHAYGHTHIQSHSHAHSDTSSHTHAHTDTCMFSHTLALTLTHAHSLSHMLTLTHARSLTHTPVAHKLPHLCYIPLTHPVLKLPPVHPLPSHTITRTHLLICIQVHVHTLLDRPSLMSVFSHTNSYPGILHTTHSPVPEPLIYPHSHGAEYRSPPCTLVPEFSGPL